MKSKLILTLSIAVLNAVYGYTQSNKHFFSTEISLDENLKDEFNSNGRMYLFISESFYAEPRTQTFPNPFQRTYIFAKNLELTDEKWPIYIKGNSVFEGTPEWGLDQVPEGEYNIQILWDQDITESRIDAPGNLYSKPSTIKINKDTQVKFILTEQIKKRELVNHALCKEIEFKSELLSQFWGKSMLLKASVLLPHGYKKGKKYPIRYNVSGYGGRYTRVNGLLTDDQFISWWDSEEAPQIITVFLDGEGPFGDSYQMDSENSGPYGESLITELIPYIENTYRGDDSAEMRFVDGCSTGGWVSLGLQLYYPDSFNGCFSYSPDAIDFRHYQLVNIYKDENVYTNEFGYERPVARDYTGEPMLSVRDFVGYENVLGSSDSYLNSGGQFSAHSALYSPKGTNGLPKPLFDPVTGIIDSQVSEHWKKYDFKVYMEQNWKDLVPKIQGKIYLWMGDMDNFYLSSAARHWSVFTEDQHDPVLDAQIDFSPMEGHCTMYSDRLVLEQIQARIELLNKK